MSHDIVRLAEILAARRGRSPRTVCRWATGDGALYGRLAGGSDVAFGHPEDTATHQYMALSFTGSWRPPSG